MIPITYRNEKKTKFRCNAAVLNTQAEVAMETELHWPGMKESDNLDFHCTSIFNHGLFLHQLFSPTSHNHHCFSI